MKRNQAATAQAIVSYQYPPPSMLTQLIVENLSCPHCGKRHEDLDEWATRPHRTHLCLYCNKLFEGSVKGVSNPHPIHPNYLYVNNPEL